MVVKCFRKIHELWTFQGAAKKQGRAVKEADLSLIKDGAMLAIDGKLLGWVQIMI